MGRRARARCEKEFDRLPASVQKRVSRALLSLEADPFPIGCKKLKNRDGGRVRVGDYRILYFADKTARQIIVGVIGNRRDVYR
ncbi:MAG: type II toxin-antitoxin system mRNA interferase toxin, RelE/StbE family [Chthoniobacterales bacterium]|nr:MAG: type II toxin-antitoxin system mRNA interferase toxin, RelE/StbE family [Chthoniobacterales bacterium]